MVRLKDIAEACGVSVATVSRALNGLTNEHKERTSLICRTAREMGYYPNAAARTLKTSRSSNIGILYEDRMNHEYFSEVLDALRSAADERGYDLTLIGRDSGSYYDHARRRNLDGVIIMHADFESQNVSELATGELPCVAIGYDYEGCDSVFSDNALSMERIVRYVFEKGHRKIAFVTGHEGIINRIRLEAFLRTCAGLGIRVPEGFVRKGKYHAPEICTAIVRDLLQGGEKPTCILCPDDFSCLGTLWDLTVSGIRVPEEVSLVGYDGIGMARMMRPALTTYRQDTEGIARAAVRLLLEAIETPDRHRPRKVIVEGNLEKGETVGNLFRQTDV